MSRSLIQSFKEWSSGAIKFDAPTMANITNYQFMNNDAGLGGNSVIASGKGGGFYLEQSTLELGGDDFEKHSLPFVLR